MPTLVWGLAFAFLTGLAVGIFAGVALAIRHRERLDEQRVVQWERELRFRSGASR